MEEGDPLGIVQAIKLRPCRQRVYAPSRIFPGEQDTKFSGILR